MRLTWCLWLLLALPSEAATFRKGPYLIYRNDPTRMVVAWQTDSTPNSASVEWGPTARYGNTSGALKESGAGTDEHLFSFACHTLVPGARCHYRVTVDGVVVNGSFLAAPAADAKSAVLYVDGDTRTGIEVHDRVCAAILRDVDAAADTRQTVLLHTGDWVSYGDDESEWDSDFFVRSQKHAAAVLGRLPIMGCLGNHDGRGPLFRKYRPYDYPDAQACYYAFDYGPVRLLVVDQYAPFGAGSRQYEWVSKMLDSAARWKVAILHEPAWSAGSHSNHAETQANLLPLFKNRGVALVLAGHNHYYARAEVDGIVHLTVGGGGAHLYTPEALEPHVVKVAQEHHFARLEFSEDTLKAAVISDSGASLDAFTVPHPTAKKPGTGP